MKSLECVRANFSVVLDVLLTNRGDLFENAKVERNLGDNDHEIIILSKESKQGRKRSSRTDTPDFSKIDFSKSISAGGKLDFMQI